MKTFDLDQYVGQTLDGYYLEQLLSHKRLSVLYRARQLETGRSVALTVFLLPETTPEIVRQQFCSQFLDKAPALTKLHHPNLLPFYGYGDWEGSPYLITPYTTEGSLATLIKERGPWSPSSILPVLEQVTTGLEYAHRNGQVHGMLTSANLLLSSNGSYQVAAIGLSNLLLTIPPYTEDLAYVFMPKGVSKYIAPEYQQEQITTIRSDIYSLGVILLELFAGNPLAKDLSAQEVLQQLDTYVPAPWQPVLRRALAANPARRFQRMNDLFVAYAALISQEEMQEENLPSVPFQPSPAPTPVDMRLDRETGSSVYVDKDRVHVSSTPARSESPVFSIPRIKAELRQKISTNRRQVTAIVAGSVVIGIAGIGGLNVARMFTAQSQTAASSTNGISQTGQAINSAVAFNDMRLPEHRQRLLIHLPNGNFVAYKQACTHTGVLVNYDPKTHLLVCPAHGAIFDPAQNGKVIMGPAVTPLPKVAIQISSTGAITLV